MEWIELYAKINVIGYIVAYIVFGLLILIVLISWLVKLIIYIRSRLRGVCPKCNGHGKKHVGYQNWWKCYTCDGTGQVKVPWRRND